MKCLIWIILVFLNSSAAKSQKRSTNQQKTFNRLLSDDLEIYHNAIIDYIQYLICFENSYHFIHVYIERSLTTTIADKMINRLSNCLTAGILTSRLAHNFFNKLLFVLVNETKCFHG